MRLRAKISSGLGLALAISCLACGDDDGGTKSTPDGGGAAGTGSAGTNANTLAGRSASGSGGGGGATGTLEEGRQCTTDNQCSSGLRCLGMPASGTLIGVCARPCASDDECGEEVCGTLTDDPADSHCINFVVEQFAFCGVAETSLCQDRSCLYFPDLLIGVCANICSTAGPEEDAGVPTDICTAPQTCIAGVVSDPALGVCGEEVPRDSLCGDPNAGKYCASGDVCVSDDAANPESEAHCREDCSTSTTCAVGTCTNYRGMFNYCKP